MRRLLRALAYNLSWMVRTRVTVSGLLKSEVDEGLPDLLDEFSRRPWLLRASAEWRGELFAVQIETDGTDPEREGQAVMDEVWDCVIACLKCSTELRFSRTSSVVIE